MVRPVTFGYGASFITSGMEAAGGLWVGQLVLAFLFAALFNFTAGYWLAASLTILLVLAIAPRMKPFHRPSSQTPALALVKTAHLEVWPETRFSPSRRFLNVDCRCNSGFLKRIAYTTMPYKTGLRLLGVARNPANGFPARLLGRPVPCRGEFPAPVTNIPPFLKPPHFKAQNAGIAAQGPIWADLGPMKPIARSHGPWL